jgi:GNAT superfamily N-acetyltransferase
MSVSVQTASTAAQLDEVRVLMRAFVQWQRHRYASAVALVDQYFDPVAFAQELAQLPGKYQSPSGQLLLATSNGDAAGCVALREFDASAGEMKRMFVYERFHGKGVGRALAQVLIERARAIGYRRLVLDTGARQTEAINLYQRLGFRAIQPYYDVPESLRPWMVFMELEL